MGRFSKLETNLPAEASAAKGRIDAGGGRSQAASTGPGRPAAAEEPPTDARGCVARAEEAFYSGEPREALRWYGRSLQRDGAYLDAWLGQVRLLLLTNQVGEAKVWINRALSNFPDLPQLLALRSAAHARSGMLRQGLALSDHILEQNGGDALAWFCRGMILSLAENRNADFCFDQAIKLSPETDWTMPFSIGFFLYGERRYARAIAFLDQALERRTMLPYAWLLIAQANAHLGRREAARRALTRAEEVCGENERLLRRIQRADTGSILSRLTGLFRRR